MAGPPDSPSRPRHSTAQVQTALTFAPGAPREVPIVTGFLAKGRFTRAVTTLGRGGSDLSATVLGAALQLKEVQVRLRSERCSRSLPATVDCAGQTATATQCSCLQISNNGASNAKDTHHIQAANVTTH